MAWYFTLGFAAVEGRDLMCHRDGVIRSLIHFGRGSAMAYEIYHNMMAISYGTCHGSNIS